MANEKLIIIDGNSLLNRAYFAIPPLNNHEGKNVNAVFRFVNILLKALGDIRPTHLAVAFDKIGKNFRIFRIPIFDRRYKKSASLL